MSGKSKGQAKKRKCAEEGQDDEEDEEDGDGDGGVRKIFLDRDPDLFAIILQFMRANRLPAAVRSDSVLLDDLCGEAEFLGLDALSQTCTEALESIREAEEAEANNKPTARPVTIVVPEDFHEHPCRIALDPGNVLHIQKATLQSGDRDYYSQRRCFPTRSGLFTLCVHRPLSHIDDDEGEDRANVTRLSENGEVLNVGGDNHVEYHTPRDDATGAPAILKFVLKEVHISNQRDSDRVQASQVQASQVDLTYDINVTLEPHYIDGRPRVQLSAGNTSDCSASWYLYGWIGNPGAIPALRAS